MLTIRRALALISLLSCFALGCGDGVDRWDGEGCQPACDRIPTEMDVPADVRAVCLDEDKQPDSCAAAGTMTVTCEGMGGVLTCDTEDGLPRCVGATVERPFCTN